MRPGGSSPKGSAYERHLAKLLGTWWYGDPDVLVRAAGSGSVLTKRAGSGLTICGEYVQVKHLDDPFPFAVEAKHRKVTLDLPCMLKLPKHYFWQAWSQCVGAANNAQLKPMLVWRTNRRADIVVMRKDEGLALASWEVWRGTLVRCPIWAPDQPFSEVVFGLLTDLLAYVPHERQVRDKEAG